MKIIHNLNNKLSMMKFLKWIGVAALVSLPIYLIVKKLRTEEADVTIEDEFDIYAEE